MNERKWQQPQFQLHLITKSHSRWEQGLLTLSAAVHLRKMMSRTMFQSIQFFLWTEYLLNISTLRVCVCVCVQGQTFFLLFSSAHLINCQLHSSYSIILASYALGFAYHWRRIRNILQWLTQISKRQCDPCSVFFTTSVLHILSDSAISITITPSQLQELLLVLDFRTTFAEFGV